MDGVTVNGYTYGSSDRYPLTSAVEEHDPEGKWRYLVTSVWGSMVGRLKVGDVIVETMWKGRGEATWTIEDKGELTGGWSGRYIGKRAA
jgi:hypothetical protein